MYMKKASFDKAEKFAAVKNRSSSSNPLDRYKYSFNFWLTVSEAKRKNGENTNDVRLVSLL